LALAPEIDRKYEKIFGYIQDDITKRRPCVSLALELFFPALHDRLHARILFESGSPLIDHGIIGLGNDPSRCDTPFLAQSLLVDRRIAGYLLGSDGVDPYLEKTVTRIAPKAKPTDLILPDDVRKKLVAVSKARRDAGVIYLQVGRGNGRRSIGEALCGSWGRSLLLVESLKNDDPDTDFFARRLCREALLSHAAVFLHDVDSPDDEPKGNLRPVIEWAGRYEIPLLLCGEKEWEPEKSLGSNGFTAVRIPQPSADERYLVWKGLINGNGPPDRDAVLRRIASTFRISCGRIGDAASTALRMARERDSRRVSVTAQDLFAACRVHSSPFLNKHARKVASLHRWDDIVLPPEKIRQLKELCASVKYRSVVYGDWGYDSKFSLGRGVHALFTGASGTGKTMAAEIISVELGLDLHKIDLSAVVSKYIGETEKNLAQIFDEAERCNVILFFDEADALMGKRSEVKDAHDRLANIEIAYLLQRMEEFEGVSLLASNLRKNIDDAFIRRLRHIVEFPFPDRLSRKKIWMKIWPPRAPLAKDIDYDFLSCQFELAGGSIRNIALNASIAAAAAGRPIAMSNILPAVRREFHKMGKVVLDERFGRYHDLIAEACDGGDGV
jgi:hypothetical protein